MREYPIGRDKNMKWRLLFFTLMSFGATGVALGDQSADSPEQIIKQLDESKTEQMDVKLSDSIRKMPPTSRAKFREYIFDRNKNGKKRFHVLKGMNLSKEEMADVVNKMFKPDEDRDLRVHLAMEMGSYKYEVFNERLRAVVNRPDENGFVQVSAAWSLALQGDTSGKKRALQSVVNAESWRDFGMQALSIMKAQDVLPALDDCMKSKDYAKKNSCRLAKLRIEMSLHEERSVELLASAMSESDYFEVRGWTARKLADIGTAEAGKVLASAVKQKKSPAHSVAIRGLMDGISRQKWTKEQVDSWMK